MSTTDTQRDGKTPGLAIIDEARFCLSSAASDEVRAKVRPKLVDEKRSAGEGEMLPEVEGYAAMYDRPADSGFGFLEVVKPGAFRNSLMSGEDCVAAPEHETGKALARRSAARSGGGDAAGSLPPGALVLEDRAEGLYYRFRPVNTQAGRDLVEQLRGGVVTQSSFRFRVRDRMSTRVKTMPDGKELRELLDVQLKDVSPVVEPFYLTTSVQLARSGDGEEARSVAAATKALLAASAREENREENKDAAEAAAHTAAVEHLQVYAKVVSAMAQP